MDNTRLEAVLVKWPELRPRLPDYIESVEFYKGGWLGLPSAEDAEDRNQIAHALIFRAMVDQLPVKVFLARGPSGRWECTQGDDQLVWHDSPMDALLAFWEART